MREIADPTLAGEFAEFYAVEFPSTVRFLRPIVGETAEDVAQEACLIALGRWGEVATLDQPGAWLRLVARRLAWRTRSRERTREALGKSAIGSPLPAPDTADPDLWRAVSHLPSRYRMAVTLHDVAGFPIEDVAAAIQATHGATKTLLSRARRELADLGSGHAGRWISRRRWGSNEVAAHIARTSGLDGAAVDLVEVAERGVRWTITFGRGRYRIATDDGEPLDSGRYRVRRGTLELSRVDEPGSVHIATEVYGATARFSQITNDTPPTRGVPDRVYLDVLLAADEFARDPQPPIAY